ncbi:hypothetical protein [Pinibacter soli]|uniref:Uncharacterized protein n=1 Tax=Pinibacter soli TaxID=3044211 RepID=A0ABT6RJ25_9BACT|nr:hypothetical protein [Pinibacter soli]MDI3322528.1 hypothetical protein [Pinibacter soli]
MKHLRYILLLTILLLSYTSNAFSQNYGQEAAAQYYDPGYYGNNFNDTWNNNNGELVSQDIYQTSMEHDYSPDGTYPDIRCFFHAEIVKDPHTGLVQNVVIDPITADPMQCTAVDSWGRLSTRKLTLFNHVNYFNVAGTSVQVFWNCLINKLFLYADGRPPRNPPPTSVSKTAMY